ncbi:MAG: CotH kinase family protein [Bacteroidaceae bacterium]|nr:CotH kinase family protein [Bacteroidaceae bacterium]
MAEKIAAKQQLTNLPTVYITVPDAFGQKINSVLDEKKEYHSASIKVIDNGTDGTGIKLESFEDDVLRIKVRGNETAKGSKKPYRLNFGKDVTNADGSVTSHKHDMLGLGYKKRNWVLLANQKDETLMHNALAYTIGKTVGMEFCPGYKFVDLVINDEYLGNYMISDHCEVGKNRIDVDEDAGWYLESNREDQKEEPYVTPTGLYISIKNPEPSTEAETTALKNEVKSYFDGCVALFDRWNSEPLSEAKIAALTDPRNGWRKYWDEESLVNYYIGVNVTGNHDGFMTVKMYRNPGGKIKFGPLWDFDTSYGQYDDGETLAEDAQAQAPLMCNFIQKIVNYDPVFVKKVHDKLQEVATPLQSAMSAEINTLEERLATSQALENPNQQSGAYKASVQGLRNYTDAHFDWLAETIYAKYEAMGGDNIQENTGGNGGESGEEGTGEDSPTNGANMNVAYVVTGMSLPSWQNETFPAEAFLKDAEYADITISVDPKIHNQFYAALRLNGEDIQVHNQGWQIYTYTFRISGEVLTAAANGQLYLRTGGGGGYTIVVLNVSSTSPGTDTPTTPETPSTESFTQLTDLPTMYLQIYKLNADGTSDKTQTETITSSGGDYHTARIVIVDKNNTIKERDEETQIRGRGNSTWSGDNLKNPYRLKFPAKTKLLSYLAEDGTTVVNNYANAKSWTLLSNKGDYSLIRNALTAELGKYMNMPFVPAYKFVDLVINGNYAGTYQISDQIQVAKDRINVNSDTGWLLSANRGGGYEEDPYFTANGATFNIKNPEADVTTATGVTSDTKYDAMKTWMANALKTKWVNSKEVIDGEALSGSFDMESLANYIIGIDITGDPDGAIDNFYMYKEADESSKMKFGPMWDYDLAYGNVTSRDHKESHFFADETYGWGYKVKQMYNTPTVIKAIWKRWKSVYGTFDSTAKQSTLTKYLLEKVDALEAIIAQSQAKNFTENKAGSVAGSNTYASHADAIAALKAWIPEHVEWLNTAYRNDYAEITGLDPDACENHTYNDHNYILQDDGTYLIGCDVCNTIKEGSETYYKFTVYPESAESTEVFATSWHPSDEHPNSIAVVEAKRSIVEKIKGWNIVCGKKTTFADGSTGLTCKDFRLTDGHPYYSGNKFVATSATYTRPLGEDEDFGMMTLPFKHQNAENDDAEFYHIDKVEGDKIHLVAIDPSIDGNASAYLPVFFKRKDGATSITVTGTDITVKKTSADKTNSTFEGWTIIGAVESTSVTADGLYEMSDAKLGTVAKAESLTIAPFRAYLSTTATDVPATLTFVCPGGEEVTVSTLVEAIKQLTSGKLTKQDIDKIVEELLNKE